LSQTIYLLARSDHLQSISAYVAFPVRKDYAIGEFFKKIQAKPWFNNTMIIFIGDHYASSAGKNEINISKYHIPRLVYNLKKRYLNNHQLLLIQLLFLFKNIS